MSDEAPMVVWKFPLAIIDTQKISVPGLVRWLHADLDPSGDACVWAVVRPGVTGWPRSHVLAVVGTGNTFPADVAPAAHIGSFVDGPFVWHVFEVFP